MIPQPIPRSSGNKPVWFAPRSALTFSAPMLVNGIALPFFPVFLKSLALSDYEIGIILALPLIVRIVVAPLVSMIADRIRERNMVLIWSGGLSLMTAIALFFLDGFWPVAIVYGLQGAFYAPYLPIVEALLITGVRRWGYDYGKLRAWGSLVFILATLAGGTLMGWWGTAVILPAMTFGFVLTTVMGFAAPRVGDSAVRGEPARRPVNNALRRKDLQMVMLGSALVQSSHSMLYVFSTIQWRETGFSGTAVGILWSAGVMAEVIVFFCSRRINRYLSAWTLLRIGCAVAVCRWILFPMPHGYAGYFALQCLHAFTFAFCHTGVQRRIVETVGENQEASAQGAYIFYNSLFMASGMFLSGLLHAQLGMSAYYGMALVAAVGLGFVITAFYHQPQSAGSGGKTSESR